jgi:hypothetical protein
MLAAQQSAGNGKTKRDLERFFKVARPKIIDDLSLLLHPRQLAWPSPVVSTGDNGTTAGV